MRYYFGENGWPKSKLGGPPETDADKDQLIDLLQVESFNRCADSIQPLLVEF